jgi:hypothetical protein
MRVETVRRRELAMLRTLLAGWIFTASCSNATAQETQGRPRGNDVAPACKAPRSGGSADVVQKLYRDFPLNGDKSLQTQPPEILGRYLTRTLVELLVADQECGKGGDICNIDFGIMHAAQGGEFSGLEVCAPLSRDGLVEVRFAVNKEPVVIKYKVERTAAGWRVADIRYEGGSSLVAILSRKP